MFRTLLLLIALTGIVSITAAQDPAKKPDDTKKADEAKKKADEAKAKQKLAYLTAKEAGPDFAIQGEYEGEFVLNVGPRKMGAQVWADGDGKFTLRILSGGLPGAGWDGKTQVAMKALTQDGIVSFTGKEYSGKHAVR